MTDWKQVGALAAPIALATSTSLWSSRSHRRRRRSSPARRSYPTVTVTVADAEKRLVPGLTKEDFEVFDNGKPQPLVYFDNRVHKLMVKMKQPG